MAKSAVVTSNTLSIVRRVITTYGTVGRVGVKMGRGEIRPYTGRDTLLQALAQAGPTFLAWRSRIRVVRPSPEEGSTKTIVINLDQMVRAGETTQNVLLQPGDIIEVPPTPLAWVGHRVRELLYPMAPVIGAYVGPSQAVEAYSIYQDAGGNDGTRGGRRRRFR